MTAIFAFTDTETTGFDAIRNQVITLSTYVTDVNYNILGEHHGKFRPEGKKEIVWSMDAEKIHKITWQEALSFPPIDESCELYIKFLKEFPPLTFIAHNMPYDRRMLKGTFSRVNRHNDLPFRSALCTLSMARKSGLLPKKMSKLNHICKHLGIELDHHAADSDARALIPLHQFLTENDQSKKILVNPMGIEFEPEEIEFSLI